MNVGNSVWKWNKIIQTRNNIICWGCKSDYDKDHHENIMATILKYLCAIYVSRTIGYKIIKMCDGPQKKKGLFLNRFVFLGV